MPELAVLHIRPPRARAYRLFERHLLQFLLLLTRKMARVRHRNARRVFDICSLSEDGARSAETGLCYLAILANERRLLAPFGLWCVLVIVLPGGSRRAIQRIMTVRPGSRGALLPVPVRRAAESGRRIARILVPLHPRVVGGGPGAGGTLLALFYEVVPLH